MDEKDLELLRILEENSRLSADEIAIMTNLSTADVENRVHSLEAAQVIKRYSTVINWERAGNGEVSAIIELKVSPERDYGYDRIAERLSRLPRTFIDCTDPALPTIAVMRERVRREPGWEVLELATGHYPQISQSESLSDILITVAKRADAGTHVRAASPGT